MRRKTLAFPLRVVDFSESSQVVSCFTRDFGLVEGIAKGAYREKSPFQGPFDLTVLVELSFVERRGPGLAIFTEATVLEGFRGLRRSWPAHVGASHVLELLRAVASAGEAEPALFDLSLRTFELLARSDPPPLGPLLLGYDTRALLLLGFLGPLDSCVECGRERPAERRAVFLSPRARGILCRECRQAAPDPRGVTLPGGAMALWEELLEGSPEDWRSLDTEWKGLAGPLTRGFGRLRTNLLERELVLLKSSAHWV